VNDAVLGIGQCNERVPLLEVVKKRDNVGRGPTFALIVAPSANNGAKAKRSGTCARLFAHMWC